ncbi:hypothetical protein HK098_005876 [Nowakowskiella sp. JEL0407]|nr:hypothetical protein HK098_005876 [Nowakowskiella sp. JEL0407]
MFTLLQGATSEERFKYDLHSVGIYEYLKNGDNMDIADRRNYDNLKKAFATFNFDSGIVEQIFCIVSSILWTGNVHLDEKKVDSEALGRVAKLLQIEQSLLQNAFQNELNSKKTAASTKREKLEKLKAMFCRVLYEGLFKLIVAQVNRGFPNHETDKSICIMDLSGFANFTFNGFNQFLINFSNEKIQNVFNLTAFQMKNDKLVKDGLKSDILDFDPNDTCLELIEMSIPSLLSILEEECESNTPSNEGFLNKINKNQHISDKPCYIKKRISEHTFGIQHFAGEVYYSSDDFVESNSVDINWIGEILNQSRSPLVRTIAKEEIKSTSPSTQFTSDMVYLSTILASSPTNYVRCIRSNDKQTPSLFDESVVSRQLKHFSVMKTLKSQKQGFLHNQKHLDFIKSYGSAISIERLSSPNLQSQAAAIMSALDITADMWRHGNTKIFYTESAKKAGKVQKSPLQAKLHYYSEIYSLRTLEKKKVSAAMTIQSLYRGYRLRKQYLKSEISKSSLNIHDKDSGENHEHDDKLYISHIEAERLTNVLKQVSATRKLSIALDHLAEFLNEISPVMETMKNSSLISPTSGKRKINYRVKTESVHNVAVVDMEDYAEQNFEVLKK